MVVLEFVRGTQAGRVVELDQARITMGRDPDSDVELQDQRASWTHCVIEWTETGYVLIDQGSSNGTYIGDDLRPVTVPEQLTYGESIWFGDTEVVFRTNLEVAGHEISKAAKAAPPKNATVTLDARSALAMMEQVHQLKHQKQRKRPQAGRQLMDNPAEIWEGVTNESVVVDGGLTEEDVDSFPESFRLRARLTFLAGPHTGREVFLGTEATTLGRDSENVVTLDDDVCSNYHTEITRDAQGVYYIRDLESRNGTAVNGRDIRDRQPLTHRGLITLGQSIIEFHAALIDERTENPLKTVAMSLPLYAFQGKVLSQYEITLGLDPTSDLFLDDRTVDRHHATIQWRGDHFQIRDTSNRGTKVNGKRIIQHDLEHEDVITIGLFTLKIAIEGLRANIDVEKIVVEEVGVEAFVAAPPERTAYKTMFRIDVPAVLKQRTPVAKEEEMPEGVKAGKYQRKQTSWVQPLETRSTWKLPLLLAAVIFTVLVMVGLSGVLGGGAFLNDPLSDIHNAPSFSAVADSLDDASDGCTSCHTPFKGVTIDNCKSCHADLGHREAHVSAAKSGEKGSAERPFSTNCLNCHGEHQTKEELQAKANGSCTSCHSSNPHKNVEAGSSEAPEGIEKAQARAKEVKMDKKLDKDGLHEAHANIQRRCIGCHAKPDLSGPVEDPRSSCGRCHGIELGDSPEYEDCVGCHGGEHAGSDPLAAFEALDKDTIKSAKAPFDSADKFTLKSLAKGMGLTFLLFLPLGFVVMSHGFYSNWRTRKHAEKEFVPPPNPDNWFVLIDPETCVGIAACAYACPYNVIELEGKPKQAVAKRIGACHGCKACEKVCTPNAIIVVKQGEGLPSKDFPDLDPMYQVPEVPGLFIIGQTTEFKGLMKNAANMGHRVIQFLKADGVSPGSGRALGFEYDVFIAGAGPGGISTAVTAKREGFNYKICEKADELANTHNNMPKGKELQANPPLLPSVSHLPMLNASKEEVRAVFKETVEKEGVQIAYREEVKEIKKEGEGFVITTSGGEYRALKVILAIGNNGNPRKPNCPGEDLRKVHYRLVDADEFDNQDIVVLGGGNSAIEAAFALADAPNGQRTNRVTLSYRKGTEKMKISGANKTKLKEYAEKGWLKLDLPTSPVEIKEKSIILKNNETKEQAETPNDHTFVFFGSLPPRKWLEKIGVKYAAKPANWNPGPTSDLSFME